MMTLKEIDRVQMELSALSMDPEVDLEVTCETAGSYIQVVERARDEKDRHRIKSRVHYIPYSYEG